MQNKLRFIFISEVQPTFSKGERYNISLKPPKQYCKSTKEDAYARGDPFFVDTQDNVNNKQKKVYITADANTLNPILFCGFGNNA